MFGLALVVFIVLFFQTAGYGQHYTKKWGWTVNNKWGWFWMEIPTVVIFAIYYMLGGFTTAVVPLIFLFVWNLHYMQRTFIFPFLIRGKDPMPIAIILMGFVFNGLNAYLQANWLFILAPTIKPHFYQLNWLWDVRFIIGAIIFISGYTINLHSDRIIRNLRPKDSIEAFEFKIPQGGMFKYVSCPSYLGEIMEWTGWAIATWSLAGLVFPVWTFANLMPRAWKNHLWYHEKFGDEYPKNRKILIPWIL